MDFVCRHCGQDNSREEEGDYSDEYESCSIVLRVQEAISRDDRTKFVSLIPELFPALYAAPLPPEGKMKCPLDLLHLVSIRGAVRCLTALLEGETRLFLEDEDLNVTLATGNCPIHHATYCRMPHMIQFLISRGARTDIRTPANSDLGSHLLPLDVALKNILGHQSLRRNDWPQGESVYKLIVVLCLIPMDYQNAFQVLKLLGSKTEEIGEIFDYYTKEEKLIEMALLLMVARERLIQTRDGFFFNRSMTIFQSINKEISSLFHEFWMGNGEFSNFSRVSPMFRSKMMFLESALLLFHVFDKVGDSIGSYIHSQTTKKIKYIQPPRTEAPKKKVLREVAAILLEAGFLLKDKDIDLTNIKSGISIKTKVRDIVGGSSSGSGERKKRWTKPRAKSPQVESGRIPQLGTPVKGMHTSANNGFRHYSSSSFYVCPKAQFQGTSVAQPCILPKSRSLLAFFALSLKRCIRHV